MPGQLTGLRQGSVAQVILTVKILPDLIADLVEFVHKLLLVLGRKPTRVEEVIRQRMWWRWHADLAESGLIVLDIFAQHAEQHLGAQWGKDNSRINIDRFHTGQQLKEIQDKFRWGMPTRIILEKIGSKSDGRLSLICFWSAIAPP